MDDIISWCIYEKFKKNIIRIKAIYHNGHYLNNNVEIYQLECLCGTIILSK